MIRKDAYRRKSEYEKNKISQNLLLYINNKAKNNRVRIQSHDTGGISQWL